MRPLTIQYDRETDGRWIAEIRSLPGCLAYGATQGSARRRVEALARRIIADRVTFEERPTREKIRARG